MGLEPVQFKEEELFKGGRLQLGGGGANQAGKINDKCIFFYTLVFKGT